MRSIITILFIFTHFLSVAQRDTVIFYSGKLPEGIFSARSVSLEESHGFHLSDQRRLPSHLEIMYDTLLNKSDSSLFSGIALFTDEKPKCNNRLCRITKTYCLYENGKKLNCQGSTFSYPKDDSLLRIPNRLARYYSKYDESGTIITESSDTTFTIAGTISSYHTFKLSDGQKRDSYLSLTDKDTLSYQFLINGKRHGEQIEYMKVNDTIVRISQSFKKGEPDGKTIYYVEGYKPNKSDGYSDTLYEVIQTYEDGKFTDFLQTNVLYLNSDNQVVSKKEFFQRIKQKGYEGIYTPAPISIALQQMIENPDFELIIWSNRNITRDLDNIDNKKLNKKIVREYLKYKKRCTTTNKRH